MIYYKIEKKNYAFDIVAGGKVIAVSANQDVVIVDDNIKEVFEKKCSKIGLKFSKISTNNNDKEIKKEEKKEEDNLEKKDNKQQNISDTKKKK